MSVLDDLQAAITSAKTAAEGATMLFTTMVKNYGSDWTKWPSTKKWYTFEQSMAAAKNLANQLGGVVIPPSSTAPAVGAVLFSDHFDGTSIDTAKWDAKRYTDGSSLSNWTGLDNISFRNGCAVFTAVKQPNGRYNTPFLSGKVPFAAPYYIEANAKDAAGYGTWSAPVWTWASPYGAGGVEIDVNEALGKDAANMYHITMHNWSVSPEKESGGPYAAGVDLTADFHKYGAAVYADHVDFFLDGVKDRTILASSIGLSSLTGLEDVANIDLAVGGWGGTPTTNGPFEMLVDCIDVWRIT